MISKFLLVYYNCNPRNKQTTDFINKISENNNNIILSNNQTNIIFLTPFDEHWLLCLYKQDMFNKSFKFPKFKRKDVPRICIIDISSNQYLIMSIQNLYEFLYKKHIVKSFNIFEHYLKNIESSDRFLNCIDISMYNRDYNLFELSEEDLMYIKLMKE